MGRGLWLEQRTQESTGVAAFHLRHFFGNALTHNSAATGAALRAKINDPICTANDIQVVFDHNQTCIGIGEALQHIEQPLHIHKMKTRGGFVQHVQRVSNVASPTKFRRQFHPLRFAARKGGGRLTQGEIPQANIAQALGHAQDLGVGFEEAHRVFNGHFQNVGDSLAAVVHFEGLSVVPLALADFAGHLHVGKKMHLDGLHPLALAVFAASAFDIEGKASDLVPPKTGFGGFGEHFSDLVKDAGVGRGVASAGAPDGRLVHLDQTVDLGQAIDSVVGQRMFASTKVSSHRAKQDLVHQGAFARARNAGHAHQTAEREGGVDALQVVSPGVLDDESGLLVQGPAIFRGRQSTPAGQVIPSQAVLVLGHLGGGALGDHGPAMHASGRANVHQVIGGPNGVFVVLDHHDGVANVGQVTQSLQQPFIVSLMQTNGRFVQHIAAAHQTRSDLGGQTNALGLAARKGVGGAI